MSALEQNPSVEKVLRLMSEAGVRVEDLVAATKGSKKVPTISEYRSRVESIASPGAASTYRTYWNDLEEIYGSRRLDLITISDLKAAQRTVFERGLSVGLNGRAASEHFVSAARLFFRTAVEDGLLERNPAAGLEKPRRLPAKRRPLSLAELSQLRAVVPAGSDDPDLDRLIVWFHLETGARRAGALNLKLKDLDGVRQTLWLTEKYGQSREQPVSSKLLSALRSHAEERGGVHPSDPVFHYHPYADGSPHRLSRKRYNTLFPRLQSLLPFSTTTTVDSHTLRASAIALVERYAGHEVARAFAGHAEKSVTSLYAKASIEEVAAAVAYLTGEPHPLAPDAPDARPDKPERT